MSQTGKEPWDDIADVVVVGSGAAGLSAAVSAADAGAEVLVLEKGAEIGGTTKKSHGFIWICDNSYQHAHGIKDPKEDALRYLARTARPADYDAQHATLGLDVGEYELIETFYDNGAKAIESLGKVGGLRVKHSENFPDYSSILPEDVAGLSRTFGPETPDGEFGSGATLIEQLSTGFLALGGRIDTEQHIVNVIRDSHGRVAGVLVKAPNGTRRVRARNGVVFATGGFTHDVRRRKNSLSGPALGGCAALTNTGDFHNISESMGIPLRNMNHAWYCPIPLEALVKDDVDPTTMSIFTAQGDSMIYVNKYGRRTMNEKGPYNEVARTMFRWDQRRREYPDLLQFPIWDQRTTDLSAGIGKGHFIPRQDEPRWAEVVSAPNLEGIREALQAKLDQLRPKIGHYTLADDFAEQAAKSIERYNVFAEQGVDEDFGRGEAPIDHAFHIDTMDSTATQQIAQTKNTMFPLSQNGPYYATIIAGGTLDTKGGAWTDSNGQVLDSHGQPVPGLYGVGNCVASASGEAYWGAGGTLGPILTYGWLAGRKVAGI